MAWLLGTEWTLYVPAGAVAMALLGGGIVAGWAVQLFYIVLLSGGLYVRWRGGRWMSIRLVETAPSGPA